MRLKFLLNKYSYWVISLTMLTLAGDKSCYGGVFEKAEILSEHDRKYTVHDIIRNPAFPFQKYKSQKIVAGEKSFWLRFIYQKDANQNVYYLHSPFIFSKRLELFYFVGDSLHSFKSGIFQPFRNRNFYFPDSYLELPTANSPTTCWLHVHSFYNYSFPLNQKESKSVIEYEVRKFNQEFFFIGLSFLAAVFSFFFYLSLKDKLYLYYTIFSSLLILARLTHNGYIFQYLNPYIESGSLKTILNLYSISYVGVHLSLVFYFHQFLKFYKRSSSYHLVIYGFAAMRFILLLIQISTENRALSRIVDHHIYDVAIQCFLLFTVFNTPKKYFKPSIIAASSIFILMIGNLRFVLSTWGFWNSDGKPFDFFVNYAGFEVIIFAIGMAYRSYFLKKEHDFAIAQVVDNLKESELQKELINKELEIKIAERTKEVQEMNALLQSHNIQLRSEITHANEARVFLKVMDFKNFQRIFATDDACHAYLAKIKWKSQEDSKCIKCGYKTYPLAEDFSRRCGKCGYVESVTNGTLFHRLKFPILKAFYITYRTSNSIKELPTIMEMAEEIDLRPGTLGNFRQKVIQLLESYSSKKKHKDGWTHLIEYSVRKARAAQGDA